MSTQTSSGSRCKCVIAHLISIALLTLYPDPFSWTQDGTAGQNSGTGGFSFPGFRGLDSFIELVQSNQRHCAFRNTLSFFDVSMLSEVVLGLGALVERGSRAFDLARSSGISCEGLGTSGTL